MGPFVRKHGIRRSLMTRPSPFFISHTIRLSRAEVLEALRGAALAQVRETLRLADPSARSVELETRLLAGGSVEIDSAVVAIEARLPEEFTPLLRQGSPWPAAAASPAILYGPPAPAHALPEPALA
jgi:hypothetical protein